MRTFTLQLFAAAAAAVMAVVVLPVLSRAEGVDTGPFNRMWDSQPFPDRSLMAYDRYLFPMDSQLIRSLPKWEWNATLTDPFTTRISTVRILGGWPNTNASYPEGDLATCNPDGTVEYHFDELFKRLDPLVEASLDFVFVMDNVPWCLSHNASGGKYGCVFGPRNQTEYGEFLTAMFQAMLGHFGEQRMRRWQYRVGTEPDCPCHWQDTTEEWIATYRTAVAALWSVLPGAAVGPGNFCNFLFGGCADYAENMTLAIIDAVCALGPVDAIGWSMYGTRPHDFNLTEAYSPWSVDFASNYMKNLAQSRGANCSSARLEFMEFGLLIDANDRNNDEPGSFGAAWTLAAWIAGRRHGVKRAYHWGALEFMNSNHSNVVIEGPAWVMAAAEVAVGATQSLALSPDELLPAGHAADVPLSDSTTAWGLVALNAQPGTVHVLLSFFDYLGYTTEATPPTAATLTVQVPLSKVEAAGGRPAAEVCRAVHEYRLSSANAVYDQMYRDLAYINQLSLTDARVHTIEAMATKEGVTYIAQNAAKYMTLQGASFQAQRFSGSVDKAHGGTVAVHVPMSLQSVVVVELQCS